MKRSWALGLALLASGASAGSKPKPPDLPQEHRHPSGAFSFRTPAGWTSRMHEERVDILEAGDGHLLVRFYYQPREIGIDGLHATCLDIRLLGPMETSLDVRYERDYVDGALGQRRVLESIFEVRYDHEINGARDSRQRNLTVVGEGESLCAIGYGPVRWGKKGQEQRDLLDAVLGSVQFKK